jgi:hypothetical protein
VTLPKLAESAHCDYDPKSNTVRYWDHGSRTV